MHLPYDQHFTLVIVELKYCVQRTFLLASTWCFMAMGADGLQIVMSHLLLLGNRVAVTEMLFPWRASIKFVMF